MQYSKGGGSPRINIPLEWRDPEEEQTDETSKVVLELPDLVGWQLRASSREAQYFGALYVVSPAP
jgi:hypothetical protein